MKIACFIAFWTGSIILFLLGIGWSYDAYVRPRVEVREILGFVPDGAQVTGYSSQLSIRSGMTIWNFSVPRRTAMSLRPRCLESGTIHRLNFLVAEVTNGSSADSASSSAKGCFLGERDEMGTHLEVILEGDIVQVMYAY